MKIFNFFEGACLLAFCIYGFQLLAEGVNNLGQNYANTAYIFSDGQLKTEISQRLIDLGGDISDRIRYAVQDSKIILIGYVKDEQQHAEVIEAIKQLRGNFLKLYDHIKVNTKMPATETADTAITARVKAKLMKPFNDVRSGNYAVTTFDGVVYIVGTSDTEEEKVRVINSAKSVGDNGLVYHIDVRP